MVGLPDKAVGEAWQRVRATLTAMVRFIVTFSFIFTSPFGGLMLDRGRP